MRVWRVSLRIASVLAALYLYFATLHPQQYVPDHPYFASPGPWVIAHQGGRGLWPENTLYAFERAEAMGVDVLEMDLRTTSDGELVVIHDATVDRTTNGTGRVDEMTLDALRELDAGYRHESPPGTFPFRGTGLLVPTLAEVFERFETARLNLEMKEFTPELATELCATLQAEGATGRVLVASFAHPSMKTFRRACPSVATSATMREGLTLYPLALARLESLYRSPATALQIPETLGERTVVEPGLLDLAREFNVHVQVWTINDEADMRRLLDLGVQGILTDYPDRLLQVLGRVPTADDSTTDRSR